MGVHDKKVEQNKTKQNKKKTGGIMKLYQYDVAI